MLFFAPLRVKLFSKTDHVKNVSAYNKNRSIFNRKTEYNFFELEKKIDMLDKEIEYVYNLALKITLLNQNYSKN